MTHFYNRKRMLLTNNVVNSVAVGILTAIMLTSTFALVNGLDSKITILGSRGSAPSQ